VNDRTRLRALQFGLCTCVEKQNSRRSIYSGIYQECTVDAMRLRIAVLIRIPLSTLRHTNSSILLRIRGVDLIQCARINAIDIVPLKDFLPLVFWRTHPYSP
jgi:hypothetical protein